MKYEVKKQLDRELYRYRLGNLKVFLVIGFFLTIFVVIGYSTINGKKTIVEGTVVSHHATVHDEGHDIVIMVKTQSQESLIRVRVPRSSTINVGSNVELRKTEMMIFGTTKYRFLRYVD